MGSNSNLATHLCSPRSWIGILFKGTQHHVLQFLFRTLFRPQRPLTTKELNDGIDKFNVDFEAYVQSLGRINPETAKQVRAAFRELPGAPSIKVWIETVEAQNPNFSSVGFSPIYRVDSRLLQAVRVTPYHSFTNEGYFAELSDLGL